MKLKAAIAKILTLEKGEGRLIAKPVIYSFFAGSSFAFFTTSATAMLLNAAQFDRLLIPFSFVVAGLLVFVAGKIFARLQWSHSLAAMLKLALGFLLCSILVFLGILYLHGEIIVVVFLIYAWIRIFAYIHAITFWGFLARLFNIQQGKRLFGIISGGEVVGAIISFLSVPLLLTFINTTEILMISGLLLIPTFGLLIIITRHPKIQLKPDNIQNKKQNKSTTKIKGNKYYSLFILIAFIPIFAQMFIDFIFQTQTRNEFPDNDTLTAFVGIFFGLSTAVEFLLKTFISGKLINRYGVKLGLLALPVMLMVSLLPAVFFGIIYGAATLFFGLIALGRLFTRAVRTSFNDPATQILYQPLPEEERIAFQNRIESGPKAFGGIAAGLFIFIFALIKDVSLVLFAGFLLLVVAFWIKIAFDTYFEYKKELQKVLAKQKEGIEKPKYEMIYDILVKRYRYAGEAAQNKLKRIIAFLYPYISANSRTREMPYKQAYALSLSENSQDRKKAAAHLHHYKVYKTEKVILRLMKDEDRKVRQQAVLTAAQTKSPVFFPYIINRLADEEVKHTAFSAVFEIGEEILPELEKFFNKIEHKTALQAEIIEVFENSQSDYSKQFLLKHISHPNQIIVNKIVKAIGKSNTGLSATQSLEINNLLHKHLKNYIYHAAALADLTELGSSDALVKALENGKKEQLQQIFDTLSALYDSKVIKLISKYLESLKADTHSFALEITNTVLSDTHKELLLPAIEKLSNYDILKKYRSYYPYKKLSIPQRLTSIISSELSTTDIYTKAQAINLLAKYPDKDTLDIFKSNLVHPNIIIKEITALRFYELYPKKFLNYVRKHQYRDSRLMILKSNLLRENQKYSFLNFEIISFIKDFEFISEFSNQDIIEYTVNTEQTLLRPDTVFEPEIKHYFYLVYTGLIISEQSRRTFESGSFISEANFCVSDKLIVDIPTVLLKCKKIFFADFIRKYPQFAEKFEIKKS